MCFPCTLLPFSPSCRFSHCLIMYSFVQKVTYQGENSINMPNPVESSSSLYTSTYLDSNRLSIGLLIIDSSFNSVPLPYSTNLQV